RSALELLQTRYGERHPEVIRAQAQIATLEHQLASEIELACRRLESDNAATQATLKEAQARLDQQTQGSLALDKVAFTFENKQRELRVQEQILNDLVARSEVE